MNSNEQQEPVWDQHNNHDMSDLVMNVGAEGMERLIIRTATPVFNLAEELLETKMGQAFGMDLGTELFDSFIAATDLGVKLGFALAMTVTEGLNGNEAWLQRSIRAAKLEDYQMDEKVALYLAAVREVKE